MTSAEAISNIRTFYGNENPAAEDKFIFVESQLYMINTYHDPQCMHNLAFFYLEQKRFDLELKYLEMAAEYDFYPSLEELGYIWYYGQTGVTDYKKAFEYFSRSKESSDDLISMESEYKLADMYHNGFYVEKDEAKYKSIIESLFSRVTHPEGINTQYGSEIVLYPDLAYRLAEIRVGEGKECEALKLLKGARIRLSENIRNAPSWWGNIEVMEHIVLLEYKLSKASTTRLNIYDLFWISQIVSKIAFMYENRRFVIEVSEEEGTNVIKFDHKWYRTPREFFEKAELDGKRIVTLYDELYDMEVEYG